MYRFSKEQVTDPAFLTKLVAQFKNEQIPRFRKLEKYYRVKNEILSRTMDAESPTTGWPMGSRNISATWPRAISWGSRCATLWRTKSLNRL